MPHDSISHWISQVAGVEIDVPLPKGPEDLVASRADPSFKALNINLPDLAVSERITLRTAPRDLTAEVHVPPGTGPFPVLLFLHGGGWYTGGAEDERKLAMQIAEQGNVVLSLDYALAPEAPFPAAVEDCVYAARWLTHHAQRYLGDPNRVMIGGTSAGANLAAATIAHLHAGVGELARDELAAAPVRFTGAILMYGVYDIARFAAAPASFAGWVEVMLATYLGVNWTTQMNNPLVSPIRAPLADFPPCYLTCGDEDGVLPQSLAMCEALTSVGVPTTLSVVEGADHVFLNIPHIIDGSATEITKITNWLHRKAEVTERTPAA